MDLEDFIVSNNLLPLGGLTFVLFCTRKNGWGWENFLDEVNQGAGRNLADRWKLYYTYGLPLVILAIYLKGYDDLFAKQGGEVLIKWLALAFLFLAWIFWSAAGKGRKDRISQAK